MKAYYILQGILIASCALSLLYLLPFAIAGLFYKQRGLSRKGPRKRMTVLIPGYKEDEVILERPTLRSSRIIPPNSTMLSSSLTPSSRRH